MRLINIAAARAFSAIILLLLLTGIVPTRTIAATVTSSTTGNWSLYSNWSNGTSGTASARTGAISASTSSPVVTGSGTLFLTELSVGNYLYKAANGTSIGEVASISSNTSLTLVANSLINHTQNITSSGVGPIDTVIISNGHTMTVNTNSTCDSLVFSTSGGTVTVNNGVTLTVSRAITIPSTASSSNTFTLAGQGTISCARVRVGNGALTPVSTQTTKLISTIASFNISGDLILNSYFAAGPYYNNPVFELQTGALDINGKISTSNPNAGNSSIFTTATGSQNGTLKLEYAGNPFSLSGTGTNTITLNGTSAAVMYDRATGGQTVMSGSYTTLTMSNSSGTQTASGAIGTTTLNNNANAASILDMVTFALTASTVNNTGTIKTQCTANPCLPAGMTWGGTVTYDAVPGGQTVMAGTYAVLNNSNTSGTNAMSNSITATTLNTTAGGALALDAYSGTIGGLTGGGTVDGTSGTPGLTLGNNNASSTFGGIIKNTAGALSLTKTGSGTFTLSGSNSYTGSTAIDAGTLNVTGSLAVESTVTVASGAVLAGNGIVAGAVSVSAGGIVAPGNGSAGTLYTGALTFNAGSALLNFELDAPAGINDRIVVTNDLILCGTLSVVNLGGLAPGVYTLLTYGGSLTDNGLAIGPMPSGFGGRISAGSGVVTLTVSQVINPAWTRTSLGTVNGGSIARSSLYIGTGPGTNAITSLDLATGVTLWSYPTVSACRMPTYTFTGGSYKVIATAGNHLVGVTDNGASYTQLWTPENLGAAAGNPYVSPDDSSICVLYGTSLSRRKMSDGSAEIAAGFPKTITNASIGADMVVMNDEVYVASTDGVITKVDYDGTPIATWTAPNSPGIYLPLLAASASDSLLYVFPKDQVAYAVRTATMATQWTVAYASADTNCGPAFMMFDGRARSGIMYYAAGKKIYKITESGGSASVTWTYSIPTDSCKSGPLVYNNKVYFGCKDSLYYAISDNGGNATIVAKWPYMSTTGNSNTGPWIDLQSSKLYFGTTRGQLDAFPLQ